MNNVEKLFPYGILAWGIIRYYQAMLSRAYLRLRKYAIAYQKSCVLSGLVCVLNLLMSV